MKSLLLVVFSKLSGSVVICGLLLARVYLFSFSNSSVESWFEIFLVITVVMKSYLLPDLKVLNIQNPLAPIKIFNMLIPQKKN